MMSETIQLLKIQLLNFFGFNEARYSKDPKKKNRLVMLMVVFAFLGAMIAGYVGLMAYSLCVIGASRLIPAFMLAITSLIILFFTMFKASGVIFQTKNYEMLVSMPIKPVSIVASRFLTMYVGDFFLSALVLIPSCVIYACYGENRASFWVMLVFSIILLPLVPMTIATAIGAMITAISSRMKHKNIVTIVLSMILIIVVIALSYSPMLTQDTAEIHDIRALSNMMEKLTDQVNGMYPLAAMYTSAMVKGSITSFLTFAGISVGVFALFVVIVGWKFVTICDGLAARSAKHNYKLTHLQQNGLLKALYMKEIKRYFASSIYVMNTAIGYVLMLLMAFATLGVGVEKVEEVMKMPGILPSIMPLLLALLTAMSSITSSSISIEGKQWWIPKSLPIGTKVLFDSKLLVHLTIACPCTLISSIILCISTKANFLGCILMIITPLAYVVLMGVLGITINVKMPMFHWDNETVVVKQGGASMITMLIGAGCSIVPFGIVLVLTMAHIGGVIVPQIVMLVATVMVCIFAAFLYKMNLKVDLKTI